MGKLSVKPQWCFFSTPLFLNCDFHALSLESWTHSLTLNTKYRQPETIGDTEKEQLVDSLQKRCLFGPFSWWELFIHTQLTMGPRCHHFDLESHKASVTVQQLNTQQERSNVHLKLHQDKAKKKRSHILSCSSHVSYNLHTQTHNTHLRYVSIDGNWMD